MTKIRRAIKNVFQDHDYLEENRRLAEEVREINKKLSKLGLPPEDLNDDEFN